MAGKFHHDVVRFENPIFEVSICLAAAQFHADVKR